MICIQKMYLRLLHGKALDHVGLNGEALAAFAAVASFKKDRWPGLGLSGMRSTPSCMIINIAMHLEGLTSLSKTAARPPANLRLAISHSHVLTYTLKHANAQNSSSPLQHWTYKPWPSSFRITRNRDSMAPVKFGTPGDTSCRLPVRGFC